MATETAASSSKRKIYSSLHHWQGAFAPEKAPLFKTFVEEALKSLRGPFISQSTPKSVISVLETAFLFTENRPRGQLKSEIRQGEGKGVVVMNNMDDQPFIVDTIRLFLKQRGATYNTGFNLVLRVDRDKDGNLTGIGGDGELLESLVYMEADNGAIAEDVEAATKTLFVNLDVARAMVADFRVMTRSVERFVERIEVLGDRHPDQADPLRETAEFLKWLLHENFVFMGVDAGQPLGVQTTKGPYFATPEGDWPPPHAPGTVRVRKSRIESPVHRAGRIDEILVQCAHLELFMRGMFTYRAVTQPSRNVPILRGVLAQILKRQTSAPGSYRYKGIANVFDSLPTEFLFTAAQDAIKDLIELVLESESQQDVGAHVMMMGPQAAFCLVAMPKTHYSDDLRQDVEQLIVSAVHATYCDHGLFVGRYDTVLLHFYLTGVTPLNEDASQNLTTAVRRLATPWRDRLWMALEAEHGEAKADALIDIYGNAFPDGWTRTNSPQRAVRDIAMLEQLALGHDVLADFYVDASGNPSLRLYQAEDIYLSEILPVLSDFGLVVVDSFATEVKTTNGTRYLDTFHITLPEVWEVKLEERAKGLVDAIEAVFAREVGGDPLNRLVLTAGLSWQEVDVIRGYARYCRQLNFKLAAARMQEIVLSHPIMCRTLLAYFHARFHPQRPPQEVVDKALEEIRDELRLITSHDDDLTFSALVTLMKATIRTNYYRTDRKFHYLSFKFDCSKVAAMGDVRPMFEIYVHHKDVEGVHLRFGKVARGGIRWSDRDDFRTEVLGLVTTQLVKNVVIVPTGSKGGFYLKKASRDPKIRRQQADRQYKTFIRGLLDLTDNAKDGTPIPPRDVVCHDPPDPYLVVAADKGTAHLSDAANKLSLEYGFWLGDAFASGGGNGYDHKKVGITARGGWVLVKRHFLEMGRDPYSEPFTVVGIGDMGGDVFGNGLVETPHAKLLGAFNHVHVFLDPNPDPAASFKERKRLFDNVLGWEHYDVKLLSTGGGIFERRLKSIPLSPEVQHMLGLFKDSAQPEEVIHEMLKMKVDLLWNGGIGTYVKASTETHVQADDRANNAVRVDATELRAAIVGEGGNLGMTQRARIEAGLRGVRLNTDAIDNSGGVDMSDHEVNLKILLDRVVERGDLTFEARNALLREMTEEVAALVLADNDAHGRQLSRDQIRSQSDIFQFARAIRFVERQFGRDRKTLYLPTDEELQRRAAANLGLTRPELSVLSAWVKMYVLRELMAGSPKTLPGYSDLLRSYFPKRIQQTYAADIEKHMLADEIAMTVATTYLVADAGAAFVPMSVETTGASVLEIASCYLTAQRLANVAELRSTLDALRAKVPLVALSKAWVQVDAGAKEVARFWLSSKGRIPTSEELSKMLAAVDEVYAFQDHGDEAASAKDMGVPKEVASRVMKAEHLNTALMVWAEAERVKQPLANVVVRHLAVSRASGLEDVLNDLATRPASGTWEPLSLNILYQRFYQLLRTVVRRTPCPEPLGTVDALTPILQQGVLAGVRAQVDELCAGEERPSIAALLVLEERVAGAIGRLPA